MKGMKVTIVLEDDVVGCNINITTKPEVDINDPIHKDSDSLKILGQLLMIIEKETVANNLNKEAGT